MKEFDYEKAKAGAPVCTRDGRPARIIYWDAKITYDGKIYTIIALIEEKGEQYIMTYDNNGNIVAGTNGRQEDLVMAPVRHEGWVYLYYDGPEVCTSHCVFRTKEDASKAAREIVRDGETQIIKIEWEE